MRGNGNKFGYADHEDGTKEVFCMPAICRDKMRLGIARGHIGKRALTTGATTISASNPSSPSDRLPPSIPPHEISLLLSALFLFVALLSSELTHFTHVPKFAVLLRPRHARRIPPQNAEHDAVRNYVRTSVFFPYITVPTYCV